METQVVLDGSRAERLVCFPRADGSRVAYNVYSSPELYRLEQERIFHGPTWSFVALEAEIPRANDFKSTFVGDTPVVITRTEDGNLAGWVNRCAHRGAIVCRTSRGNARTHICVYHQWSYDPHGNLRGVPFRKGVNGLPGMPSDFDPKTNGLEKLRVASYRGVVFASFSRQAAPLTEYLGAEMRRGIDRLFHKPVEYLGCVRQYAKANWKLYNENVRDPYHASLLHAFFSTFNVIRAGMRFQAGISESDLHFWLKYYHTASASSAGYKESGVASFKEGLKLEDPSVLERDDEFSDGISPHIQSIFPQAVVTQIQSSLAVRQILPKGRSGFELIFHFFGYADDTPEIRRQRIKQANLVGPAGLISMEDSLATELVCGSAAGSECALAVIDMGRDAPDAEQIGSDISEAGIRRFWRGYQRLMGLRADSRQSRFRPLQRTRRWRKSSCGMNCIGCRNAISA
jgi:anthranilate 1,2-dioxygenase large subunit